MYLCVGLAGSCGTLGLTQSTFGLGLTARSIDLGLAFGLLFAWLHVYHSSVLMKFKYHFLFICILILSYQRTIDLDVTSKFAQVVYLTLSPMALSLSLPFFYSIQLNKNKFTEVVTLISKISYSMYLINLALVIEIIHINFI